MMALDSATIAINRELVEVVGEGFSNTFDEYGSLIKQVAKPNILGLNSIEVRPDIIRFEVSAKILLEQYKDGININTIARVFDAINSSGMVKLKTDNLADFEVHKCDFVADLHTSKPHHNYYNSLSLIYNKNYRNEIYTNKVGNNGFAFIGKQSSKNKYLKFYSKENELHRACNKVFVSKVGLDQLTEYFQHVIRIEFRAISLKQIRSYGEIQSNNLASLLLSQAKPLHKIFCEVLRGNSTKPCILELANITTTQELDNMLESLGYTRLLEMYNNELGVAVLQIKSVLQLTEKHSSNRSRKLKHYKDKLQTTLMGDTKLKFNYDPKECINEIIEFLSNN